MIELDHAVKARESLAACLFERLEEETHDGVGITRASYGEGEQFAHILLGECAKSLGLQVECDAAGNTFMVLPGANRDAPAVIVGSHLDSVARGGNFDGAAGVIAGLVATAALQDTGLVPARDVRVMAIRGEEGEWFGVPYIGSRSALGMLPASALGLARNSRLERAFGAAMREAGTAYRRTAKPARRLRDFTYRTRKSWSRRRRVVGKAEYLSKGANQSVLVVVPHIVSLLAITFLCFAISFVVFIRQEVRPL